MRIAKVVLGCGCAQLAEWWLRTPRILRLNPAISNLDKEHLFDSCKEKTRTKKKRQGMAH